MKLNLVKNICRLGAVGGLVATAYFSAKNGEAICRTCKQVNDESFGMTKSSKIKYFVRNTPRLIKPLAPTVACAAGTITCMAISERISYKQIAALTATCVYLTKNRDFLEGKLKEVVGEDTVKKFKEEFVKKNATPPNLMNFPSVELTANGDLLCLEAYSGRWFRSSKEAVEEAHNVLKKMHDEGLYISFNDYYSALGITMTQFGWEFGWPPACSDYGETEMRFTSELLEPGEWDERGPSAKEAYNEPLLLIKIDTMPMECWQEV